MVKKIMMVDDSPELTFTAKFALEKIDPDYNVICADGGDKCFELLENNEAPDLILLDIMMPGMNGWQVFKKLRKNAEWKKIPIVFLTAKTDNTSKAFGKILAEAYIEKPFEPNDLKERVDKILEKPFVITETKEKIIGDMIEKIIQDN